MRALLAALIFCALAFPARAAWVIPQSVPERAKAIARLHIAQAGIRPAEKFMPRAWSKHARSTASPAHSILSAACQIARALGGPCGCFTSEYFFGHSVRGLWLANAWLSFPHVAPAPGTAAVWPNRHVAPVIAANSDGTVTVRDFWAVHQVRVAGLVFVDPRVGLPPRHARRRSASV